MATFPALHAHLPAIQLFSSVLHVLYVFHSSLVDVFVVLDADDEKELTQQCPLVPGLPEPPYARTASPQRNIALIDVPAVPLGTIVRSLAAQFAASGRAEGQRRSHGRLLAHVFHSINWVHMYRNRGGQMRRSVDITD